MLSLRVYIFLLFFVVFSLCFLVCTIRAAHTTLVHKSEQFFLVFSRALDRAHFIWFVEIYSHSCSWVLSRFVKIQNKTKSREILLSERSPKWGKNKVITITKRWILSDICTMRERLNEKFNFAKPNHFQWSHWFVTFSCKNVCLFFFLKNSKQLRIQFTHFAANMSGLLKSTRISKWFERKDGKRMTNTTSVHSVNSEWSNECWCEFNANGRCT